MVTRAPAPPLAALAALTLLAGACGTSRGPAPSRLDSTSEGGFTITQTIRVGVGVRRDFEVAQELMAQERHAEAAERLQGVTGAAPQLASGHLNLGIAYAGLEEFEKAEKSLREALALAPDHPAAWNELGIALRRQGRFEEARKSYERALAVAPGFHFAHRNLAILCDLFLADATCALEHYERYAALSLSEDKVDIWITDLRNRSRRSAE